MQDDRQEQDGPGDPEARAVQELAQEDGVPVDRLRAQVDRHVADHVAEHETEKDGPRHGHDDLAADR